MRTRYSIGDGSDLNRIKNQQLFLRALSEKLANENWLASAPRLPPSVSCTVAVRSRSAAGAQKNAR